MALGFGEETAWVEGLIVDTTPLSDAASLAERKDAVGDLLRMLARAGDDAGLLKSIEGDVGELVQRLPQDVRDEIEEHGASNGGPVRLRGTDQAGHSLSLCAPRSRGRLTNAFTTAQSHTVWSVHRNIFRPAVRSKRHPHRARAERGRQEHSIDSHRRLAVRHSDALDI